MNTFSTSPDLTLRMARYTTTEPAAQAEARATIRALRAQHRQERARTRNPIAALARRIAVSRPTANPTAVSSLSH